ncbi:DUF3987 domain-containing protein [Ruegeria atlantica]|uniref:DUF3987 domain-containing protein n=1 Tax=Ruegeria atlantica TaxID=81569 RepID=UPI00148130A9|nr:DUF3987 domain-containing protein [Ruegeria atlantica]
MGGQDHPVKLWSVVLGPSGVGKTLAIDKITEYMTGDRHGQPAPIIESASSAARFVEDIEAKPRGLFSRDEFGQFLHQIQNIQYMEEIKDVLLRAYSGSPIERKTKETDISISNHAINILGLTVGETFSDQIRAASLVDGFAQRFNYILAPKDPARPTTDFPICFENDDTPEMKKRKDGIRSAWERVVGHPDLFDAVFEFDQEAISFYKNSFKEMFNEEEVPTSFYRRTAFSAFSYAVIFHTLAAKPGLKVEKDSMSLAIRMIGLHLEAARDLLKNYGLSELELTIQKAEKVKANCENSGKKFDNRALVSGVREIKNAAQARGITELMR